MRESGSILMVVVGDGGLDGLDADRRRVEALRALGPGSEHYVGFGLKLRDYAIHTLMKQWNSGDLRGIVARKTSVVLPLPPPSWTVRHIRSIVGIAVCRSVEPFLELAVMQRGWKPEGGARISSFFVGRCYYAFADDFRREYREEADTAEALLSGDQPDLELDVVRYVQRSVGIDPETVAVNRAEIRRLLGLATHARIPEIVFLLDAGMTRREIGARLGMTEDAVNNAVRKFRGDVVQTHRRVR